VKRNVRHEHGCECYAGAVTRVSAVLPVPETHAHAGRTYASYFKSMFNRCFQDFKHVILIAAYELHMSLQKFHRISRSFSL
jgi:succinylglutamate desuccinylase